LVSFAVGMNKLSKGLIGVSSLGMALILTRFAVSKLAGWEISIKAFIEMAQPLGIDPTLFRVSTGIVLLLVVLAYAATALYSVQEKRLAPRIKLNYSKFASLSNLAGLLTMAGALLAEFYLRLEPKWLLVYIAIGIILFSSINIYLLNKKKYD